MLLLFFYSLSHFWVLAGSHVFLWCFLPSGGFLSLILSCLLHEKMFMLPLSFHLGDMDWVMIYHFIPFKFQKLVFQSKLLSTRCSVISRENQNLRQLSLLFPSLLKSVESLLCNRVHGNFSICLGTLVHKLIFFCLLKKLNDVYNFMEMHEGCLCFQDFSWLSNSRSL